VVSARRTGPYHFLDGIDRVGIDDRAVVGKAWLRRHWFRGEPKNAPE
jgi:hypothetical protein